MNILAGGLEGVLGVHVEPMFGYEKEYAEGRSAGRIVSAIVGAVAGGAGLAKAAIGGVGIVKAGAAGNLRSVARPVAAIAVATAASGLGSRALQSVSKEPPATPDGRLIERKFVTSAQP